MAHVAVVAETYDETLPEHITLYKGKSAGELMAGVVFIRDDGSVNLNAIATYPGGDFNHVNVAWYWTPQIAAAERYRLWAADRDEYAET